jgi:phospholipid/cholesterol/gamma-HCH transport system substrate-binding protein
VSVDRHRPPYKTAGAVFLVVLAVIAALIYLQYAVISHPGHS